MIRVDPRANETRALRQQAGSFEGLRVLEIGAGDGRLTRRFAGKAAHLVALEPDAERYQRRNIPTNWNQRVQFLPLSLEDYLNHELRAGESFDRVLLSWSL
jgi:16S rRNA A1518/A1519 N6-dimethyltransferase RsmA/KsgA/DIM1 with predicted DNA glycosylase/AP lyase activity